ncbi:MAG: hypothetical protein ACE5FD_14480 [Anaerolineae bacterium]
MNVKTGVVMAVTTLANGTAVVTNQGSDSLSVVGLNAQPDTLIVETQTTRW